MQTPSAAPGADTDGRSSLAERIRRLLPEDIAYILLLLLASRAALTIIGVVSRVALEPFHGQHHVWKVPYPLWLGIWYVWDSGWYLGIAQYGYTAQSSPVVASGMIDLTFFPLYPILMRCLGLLTGGGHYLWGLFISNACLIATCVYLRRMALLEGDAAHARNAVRYLALFPTTFILSGIFSESLYLMLAVIALYYARRERWWAMGLAGFFLGLSRSLGVCVMLPLAIEYMSARRWRLRDLDAHVLWLVTPVLGLGVYAAYNWHLNGDPLAFVHSQVAWGRKPGNPLTILWDGLWLDDINLSFGAWMTLALLLALLAGLRQLRFSYWIFAVYSLAIPLQSSLYSLPRYSCVMFPLFLLFARWGRDPRADATLSLALALLQGCLMVFWANGFILMM